MDLQGAVAPLKLKDVGLNRSRLQRRQLKSIAPGDVVTAPAPETEGCRIESYEELKQ